MAKLLGSAYFELCATLPNRGALEAWDEAVALIKKQLTLDPGNEDLLRAVELLQFAAKYLDIRIPPDESGHLEQKI